MGCLYVFRRGLTEWADVGEALEVERPPYAGAIRSRRSGDLTADFGVGSGGEDGLVGDAGGVVGDNGSVTEFSSGL